MSAPARKSAAELELSRMMGELALWPLDWALFSYPWGQPGPLSHFQGPTNWQAGFLRELGEEIRARGFNGSTPVEAIRESTVSGHGIGKSALVAMLAGFILSTRPFCKGVVTANTFSQLETKTWAEITKWMKMCVTSHWFKITNGRGAMRITHVDYPDQWRLDGIAWREQAPEAFAGLHAANSTPFYIFDEASGIPTSIFDVAKGGLTDGEPMEFLFGNGTKNSGYFFDTQHSLKHRYICRSIDSRTVEITNKEFLQEILDDYGEDSDTARVRVLGQFPKRSFMQFIDGRLVDQSFLNKAVPQFEDPLIFGCDVARYGDNKSVICPRKGNDARSIPWLKFEGIGTMQFAVKIAEYAAIHNPDAIFVDGSGVGGPVVERLRDLNVPNVIEVNGGSPSDSPDFANKATEMWGGIRKWLPNGALPNDTDLKEQLIGRDYEVLEKQKHSPIILESKKIMRRERKKSPDDADALGFTFAYPVVSKIAQQMQYQGGDNGVNYNPHEAERLTGGY